MSGNEYIRVVKHQDQHCKASFVAAVAAVAAKVNDVWLVTCMHFA